MRLLIEGAALAFLLSITGCSGIDPEAQRELAARRVNFTTWGIYCINQACGIGYLMYQRNPIENLQPANPEIVPFILKP